MKSKLLFGLLFLITYQISAQIERPIGINLVGPRDWSEEFVFVDIIKQSRAWVAHENTNGAPWSSEVDIPLRADGYPLEIPYDNGIDPPQAIRTLMYFGDELAGNYPGGNYRLIASGTGQIQLWGAASGIFTCPVDTMVFVDPNSGGIALEINVSQASDPVHGLHFIMPGFENTYQDHPFSPELLEFLEDFQVIRFMDWMNTNNSPVVEWEDRNSPDYFSQTLPNGVAYEHLIDLCNRTQKDPWINIPHQASDDYIRAFANFLESSLDPNLKIYVEYSNEVWNGIFAQNLYADSVGLTLGYTGDPWVRAWKYTAKRSADVFQIFENEFADDSRFIKIIPAFGANSWVTNYIIERFNEPLYNPTQIKADAVAVAPYFGGEVANAIGDAGQMDAVSVEDILDSLSISLANSFPEMEAIKVVADQYNLDMLAYEGGQHLVAGWPYHDDEAFVEKLLEANRHPRMKELYCEYFDYWFEMAGGGLFANFSSHGNYSKWGAWGVKEFYADTLAPKYMGLKECVFEYNTPITTEVDQVEITTPFSVFPNPSADGLFYISGESNQAVEILVYDLLGRILLVDQLTSFDQSIPIHIKKKGAYILQISTALGKEHHKLVVE